MSAVNCLKCKHYYATWDPQLPRGCRLFAIKSKLIPNQLVRKESGGDCQGFEAHPKHSKESANKPVDYNDPKYW